MTILSKLLFPPRGSEILISLPRQTPPLMSIPSFNLAMNLWIRNIRIEGMERFPLPTPWMSHPLCEDKNMNAKPSTAPATEIAFILDRSGSMGSISEAAIGGFNQFLREQRKTKGIARITLVLFDDEILVPADNLPVSELVDLDTISYVPRGSTALLDAIGKTIKRFRKRIKNTAKKDRPK